MKLVAYLRVSVANHGDSLDAQAETIRTWAESEGHQIVGTYSDDGISGAKGADEREGLALAIGSIVYNGAEGLALHRLDRLARELHLQEAILAQVWDAGGCVFEVIGGEVLADDPTDPMRTFARQVCGAARQLERGMIVARMQGGRRRARERGKHIGGSAPYGYRVAESGNLLPIAEEQEHIRRVVELRTSGATFRAIAETLEREGAGKWSAMKCRRIWERNK
jgi:DNA invertase Pin-like site-specific DNA recombinase